MPDDWNAGPPPIFPDDVRAPPHSNDAEQSILGALLLDNSALDRIETLRESDFYSTSHRVIFAAIARLVRAGGAADVLTLAESMAGAGTLDTAGGMPYLGELLAAVPTAANVEHYAAIVRDRATRRAIAAAGSIAMELAYERGQRSAADLLAAVSARFAAIQDADAGDGIARLGDYVPAMLEAMEQRGTAAVLPGLSTGLKDLDVRLLGLQPADLVVIGGRPSHGKTTLGMGIAIQTAQDGKPALVFSVEMRPRALAERGIAHLGRVNAHAMRSGNLSADDWAQIMHAAGKLRDLPLYVDASPRLTVDAIRSRARKLHRQVGGLRLVLVDYLQLLEGQGDNRNEQISTISRGFKLLANELECPVVLLSQLSRKCEERTDKRPMLSDLRDSGAVEQDADVVVFVYRDELYRRDADNEGKAELIIAKNREGETGRVFVTFMGQFNRFGDTEWSPSMTPTRIRKRRDIEDD